MIRFSRDDLRSRLGRLLASAPGRMGRFLATPVVAASIGVAVLSGLLWHQASTYIEDVSSTLMGIRELVAADSQHYLAIADSLREGDWSMDYVKPTGAADRAHRQPGFPALLALAGKLGAQGAPSLARVNVAVHVASLWIAFVGVRIATGSALAGLLAAAVIYGARFLFEIAVGRLLTEPLYVAVALGAVTACLSYLRHPGAASLLLAASLSGLAYLVRVNGLFLAFSLAMAILAADMLRLQRAASQVPASQLARHAPSSAYAVALALFAVVTAPSWIPRAYHAGNPVYHGYLANYLWVDDYERAHVPGAPRFSFSDYRSDHDAADAIERMRWGIQRVFWETPREKFGLATSAGLAVALLVLLALRDRAGLLLACAAVLQALPLAWIAEANPARRVPAAALLPFAAVLIAVAAAALLRRSAGGAAQPTPQAETPIS